jgi:hypothetical protein
MLRQQYLVIEIDHERHERHEPRKARKTRTTKGTKDTNHERHERHERRIDRGMMQGKVQEVDGYMAGVPGVGLAGIGGTFHFSCSSCLSWLS